MSGLSIRDCGFLSLLLTLGAAAQEFQYVENGASNNEIALGYEVPIPVDSLTPVDGFRTYNALDLRHQQLVSQYTNATQLSVGQTVMGWEIWAYRLSDSDTEKASGGVEQSALINGGIHAREWQSPEAATGLMENLLERAGQNHLEQYLLDNLNLLLIPVLNIDGFLQTQRYPTTVTLSATTPREGRMRRKNLNSVDEDITTTSDNQLGVDLNRNNAPYWATSTRSSSSPSSLVYHGTSPGSEPETQALQQGAALAGTGHLAFYMDMHSFSQLYYAPQTNSSSRNVQASLVSSAMRTGTDNRYIVSPVSAGGGIGATDEYFANTFEIPSFTLEIEPQSSAVQYGGNGVSHDGFILPNGEVARMREEITRSTIAGLYAVTDVPYLEMLEIIDGNDNVLVSAEWQSSHASRELAVEINAEPAAETEYRLRIGFNKPMRALNEEGQATDFGNLSDENGMTLHWQAIVDNEQQQWSIDATSGQWLTDSLDVRRYRTDTFEVTFQFPAGAQWQTISDLWLVTDTVDMAGFALDTNPVSVAQWQNGGWQGFEDSNDNVSGFGGIDESMVLLGDPETQPEPEPEPDPPVALPVPPEPASSGGSVALSGLLLLIALRVIRARCTES
ncbi:MAG: M14 family zinc carboxypeptidase [Aestuariibacter sp.]